MFNHANWYSTLAVSNYSYIYTGTGESTDFKNIACKIISVCINLQLYNPHGVVGNMHDGQAWPCLATNSWAIRKEYVYFHDNFHDFGHNFAYIASCNVIGKKWWVYIGFQLHHSQVAYRQIDNFFFFFFLNFRKWQVDN